MKKILSLLTIMLIIFLSAPVQVKVQANEKAQLEAQVSGEFDLGKEIEISVYGKNLRNLYAGDIRFKFDNTILQITSIEKGSLLNKEGVTNFEQKTLPTDNGVPKDIARYIFTAVGENDGYSGEGTLVVFKAKVLKKAEYFINAKAFQKELNNEYNMRIDLVDSSIEDINYDFISYRKVSAVEQNSPQPGEDKPNTSPGGSADPASNLGTGGNKPANGSTSNGSTGNTAGDKEDSVSNKEGTSVDESNNNTPGNNEEIDNEEKKPSENSNDYERSEEKENEEVKQNSKGQKEKGKINSKFFLALIGLVALILEISLRGLNLLLNKHKGKKS